MVQDEIKLGTVVVTTPCIPLSSLTLRPLLLVHGPQLACPNSYLVSYTRRCSNSLYSLETPPEAAFSAMKHSLKDPDNQVRHERIRHQMHRNKGRHIIKPLPLKSILLSLFSLRPLAITLPILVRSSRLSSCDLVSSLTGILRFTRSRDDDKAYIYSAFKLLFISRVSRCLVLRRWSLRLSSLDEGRTLR